MQIVINIPEKTFKDIKMLADYGYKIMHYDLIGVISKGTPLPEPHGDLIEVNKLPIQHYQELVTRSSFDYVAAEDVRKAPIILKKYNKSDSNIEFYKTL